MPQTRVGKRGVYFNMMEEKPSDSFPTAWQRTKDALAIWNQDVKAKGAELVMVAMPLTTVPVPVFNQRFAELGKSALDEQDIVDPSSYFYQYLSEHNLPYSALAAAPVDAHFSDLSHQILADYLTEWFIAHKLS